MKKLTIVLAALLACTVVFASCDKTEDVNSSAVYTDVGEYSVGTATETGYESGWNGIKFTPSGDIAMCSDAELAEINSADNIVYEMMAESAESGETVLVGSTALAEGVSFEDYMKAENEAFAEQYSWGNFKVENSQIDNAEFGGRTYNGTQYIVTLGENEDSMKLYQRVYRAQLGDRVCEICFTYSDEAGFATLMGCFEK